MPASSAVPCGAVQARERRLLFASAAAATSTLMESSKMTDHLTFECPHCSKPVDVKEELLGGNIDCPHCDHTFQAKAPLGRLMSSRADSGGAASHSGNAETTLRVVRPVLFRQ